MSKSKVNLTKETILESIGNGATSISGIWKAIGGKGNISGSTVAKIKALLPDIQSRLDANKVKPTEKPGSPEKASVPVTPATEKPTKAKPTTPKKQAKPEKPAKQAKTSSGKYPRHKSNPFRENSAYATCFDILAAHKNGIGRDEILNLIEKETHKDPKHAGYDLSVLLSAKESPTGPRHRSCREGFWVKREHHHYTLMLS